MSSPIYELLKRPDELFVVEHAHLQPRFVEDSVRISLQSTLERYPELDDEDFVLARQVNFETIHSHDVLAERYGTVGELRARARDRRARSARHTELTRLARVGLTAALKSEAVLGPCAGAGAMFARCSTSDRGGGDRGEQRSPATGRRAATRASGSESAAAIDASDA